MANFIKLDGSSIVAESIVAEQEHIDSRSDGPWESCPAGVGIGYKKTGSMFTAPMPAARSVSTGMPLSLYAYSSGASPSYQWKKDGVNIDGATSASYTIASVVSGDAGSYTCVVTSGQDEITTSACVVTVA